MLYYFNAYEKENPLCTSQNIYRVAQQTHMRPLSVALVLAPVRGLLQQLSLYCPRSLLQMHLLIIILRFVYVVKLYNRFFLSVFNLM